MDSEKFVELVVDVCDDCKVIDICLICVDEVFSLVDWMVIVGGQFDVQVCVIVWFVEDCLEIEVDLFFLCKEGLNEGCWVFFDYGDVIVYVFMFDECGYYDFEVFWSYGES